MLPDFIMRDNIMYRLRITKDGNTWHLAYATISWPPYVTVKGEDLDTVMANASKELDK